MNKYVLYTEDVEREIQIETLSIHHLIIYSLYPLGDPSCFVGMRISVDPGNISDNISLSTLLAMFLTNKVEPS